MKKPKKYKAAIIGCGNIGTDISMYSRKVQPGTHAGAYCFNNRTTLVALVDINEDKLKKTKKYFPNINIYTSAKKMFEIEHPDIVSVASNTKSHHENVIMAAKYKTKVILCEKPIASTEREALAMILACKKSGSKLFINHQRRFDPLLIKWSNKVKEGFLGEIFQASAYYYNGLFNNGTHLIDFLRMYLGDPIGVTSYYNRKTTIKEKGKNIDGLLFFKKDIVVSFQSLSPHYGYFHFDLYGENGKLSIGRNVAFRVEYWKKIKNEFYSGYYQLSDKSKKEGNERSMLIPVINNIVSYLDGKSTPLSTGEDGLAVLKILLSIDKSAKANGKLIRIKS